MNKDQILEAIRTLSYSQGSYGRLYEYILENNEILEELEKQNFKDVLDMVLYLES